MLIVMGENGSGKSTLLKTLSGAWAASTGEVRLGGIDVHAWDGEDRGRHIGLLPQPPSIFPGTVGDNVSRWEGDTEKIRAAARETGFEGSFNRLPKHLDTWVADSGENLSVGMRQRLGLASAVYGDPGLIILDEPETGLDRPGIEALLAMIRRAKEQKKTLVVASHRDVMVELADQVLLLQDGKMRKYGPKAMFAQPSPPQGRT